jgi:uncharacterized membrane protein
MKVSATRDVRTRSEEPMERSRVRFWVEAGASGLCLALAILSLFWRDWVEALTGWDPDHHNGSFEWLIVAALAVVALVLGVLARRDWRQAGEPALSGP